MQRIRPVVRFAFFCGRAKRNDKGFIDATHLFRTFPRVADRQTGVNIAFVFCVDGMQQSTSIVELALVTPTGKRAEIGRFELDLSTGSMDGVLELGGMSVREVGEYGMEFRFDGEKQPSHVARLRIVAPEVGMSQRVH